MPIVEVPGIGDVEFPDDMSDDQIAAAIKKNLPQKATAPQPQQAKTESLGDSLKHGAGVVGRSIIEGVTGIPNMIGDAAVHLYNLGQGKPYEVTIDGKKEMRDGRLTPPSQQQSQVLNQLGLPRPRGAIENIGSFAMSAAVGGKIPAPSLGPKAPAGFVPVNQSLRDQALRNAQKEGYVVPPASNNPSFGNRMLEGISGKLKLQQEAATRNQAVTDSLMARSIGQNPTVPILQGSLPVLRKEAAHSGYDPIRAIGEVTTDQKYMQSLEDITKSAKGAARSFPGLKPSGQVDEIVSTLKQERFDAADGIDAVGHLRELADDAYGSGNKLLGKAYKSASKAIEDMIERHLEGKGKSGANLLKNYREARQLLAKTYTAGKALSGDTGNFSAHKVASELAKGKPLTGEQKTVADFATRFRKATALQTESFPSVSPLDAYGSAIAAGSSGSVAPLMIPLTRVGLREYLLSPQGQQRAIRQMKDPRTTLGAAGAIPATYQGLFSN